MRTLRTEYRRHGSIIAMTALVDALILVCQLLVGQRDNFVEKFVELIARSPQALHDIDRPLHVLYTTLLVPIFGRAGNDVANVADLVGKFNDLGTI